MKMRWKKATVFLLSVVMTMMMSGIMVFADGNVAKIGDVLYPTIQAAINEANSGETIQLQTDTTEDITIPSEKNIILDLNGCTLTNSSSHTIMNNGELVIEDSSTDKTGTVDNITHGKGALYNDVGATATLNGGKFTRSKENGQSSSNNGGNSWYAVLNHGTMTINDGVQIVQNGHYSSLLENGWQNGNQNTNKIPSILTIKGGTFDGGLNTIKNDDCGQLTIEGGEFKNVTQAALLNWNVATIKGGTFTSDNQVIYNGYADNDGMNQGVLNIEGGNFISNNDKNIIVRMGGSDSIGDVKVSGGTFSKAIPETYCAPGFAPVVDENGNFTVASCAQIGDTKYGTLQEAVQAAQSGDTVELLCNVTVSTKNVTDKTGVINIDKDITIKGNGYTISAEGDKADVHVINVINGATVSVENLIIDGGNKFQHGIQAYTAPGSDNQTSLSLKNVTIKNNVGYGVVVNASKVEASDLCTEGNGWGGVNVDSKSATAKFDIDSGKISEDYSVVVESENDGQTTTSIRGGSYKEVGKHPIDANGKDTIVISGGTFTSPVLPEYCAENYKPVQISDNTYGVLPELKATATGYTGKYDGKAHGITVKAEDGAKITYSTEENGNYTTDMPACIDVGTYQIYYKVEKDGSSGAAGSATVTIEKKAVTVTAKDQTITIGDDIKTGTTEISADTLAEGDKVTDVTLTINAKAATEGGKITPSNVTIKAGNKDVTENYDIKYVDGTLTVNKGSLDVQAEGYNGKYDGKGHSIIVTAPEGTKVTYSESKNGTYTETNPTYTEVGTYVVYYKVEKGNYTTVTGSAKVVIREVSFDVNAENYVGTYDGKAHSITVTAPEGANITYATKKEGPYTETNPTFTAVGTHRVYYKVETEQKTITGEASVIIEAEKALAKSAIEKNESALNVKIAAAWKGSSIEVKWGKVSGAKGYDIYVQECSKSFTNKNIVKTVSASKTSVVVTKAAGKKLNKNKNYKVVVRAYRMANGKKEYIAKSLTIHFAAKNSKTYTDAKKVTLAKKTFTLKKGKTAVLKAKITKKNSKRKLLTKGHGASLRYWSTNKKVATVTSSGKVKAVAKGSCYVYATSLNGTKARAKITVK